MWISDALQERKWHCAEAAELTQWLSLLSRRSGKIPAHAFTRQFSSIQDILSSVRRLRHTAVHRLPITARGTCDLIQSAAKLSEVLRDPFRTAQLESIAQTLGPLTRDMELHKSFLENTPDVNLQTIRQQREEASQEECELCTHSTAHIRQRTCSLSESTPKTGCVFHLQVMDHYEHAQYFRTIQQREESRGAPELRRIPFHCQAIRQSGLFSPWGLALSLSSGPFFCKRCK